MTRHPEEDLTVLWQRHLPEGLGTGNPGPGAAREDIQANDVRIDAVADLGDEVAQALLEHADALNEGDLVVTISRRPSLAAEETP